MYRETHPPPPASPNFRQRSDELGKRLRTVADGSPVSLHRSQSINFRALFLFITVTHTILGRADSIANRSSDTNYVGLLLLAQGNAAAVRFLLRELPDSSQLFLECHSWNIPRAREKLRHKRCLTAEANYCQQLHYKDMLISYKDDELSERHLPIERTGAINKLALSPLACRANYLTLERVIRLSSLRPICQSVSNSLPKNYP
jgi:hypothetical protein